MKTVLALILAFALCLGLLAGCGTSPEPEEALYKNTQPEEEETQAEGTPEADPSQPSTTAPTTEATQATQPTTAATTAPQTQPEAPTQSAGYKKVYSDYLVNGGYQAIAGKPVDSGFDVETCLVEMDGDDVPELLVVLYETSMMGPRGCPSYSALLTIQNDGQAHILTTCSYSGGTLGGEHLYLYKNQTTGKNTVGLSGDFHIDMGSYMLTTKIYSYNGQNLTTALDAMEGYFNVSLNQDHVDQIRGETSVYELDGEDFNYFTLDGSYVTRDAYQSAVNGYAKQTDGMTKGSVEDPLNLQ